MDCIVLDPKQKALQINFDPTVYGTFAEIGGGQEVARIFFKAGAASGTIAKTMSAYDMAFSDAIYGKENSGRYVCESRLDKMLTHEYKLLEERLTTDKYDNVKFFSYANTVTVTNYFGTVDGRGWMGVKFQLTPDGPANVVKLFVKLKDKTSESQQDVLGILGVNLVHACYYCNKDKDAFIDSLLENLKLQSLEIELLKFEGPDFKGWDNRVTALKLVNKGLTNAVMFDESGNVILASDELYKKNVLAVRGSYRPITKVNMDILEKGKLAFEKDISGESLVLAELTLSKLESSGEKLDESDFLGRVDMLALMGQRVLITNYEHFYNLSNYFGQYKVKNIGIVLGGYNFKQIFDEKVSESLAGGLFESLALLFRKNVKVYVYPYKEDENAQLTTSKNLAVDAKFTHLYQHLLENNFMKDIEDFDDKIMHIYSRKVLNLIASGDSAWKEMVPKEILKRIELKKLYGLA